MFRWKTTAISPSLQNLKNQGKIFVFERSQTLRKVYYNKLVFLIVSRVSGRFF